METDVAGPCIAEQEEVLCVDFGEDAAVGELVNGFVHDEAARGHIAEEVATEHGEIVACRTARATGP